MKRFMLFFSFALLFAIAGGCGSSNKPIEDITGVYSGVVPCDDCDGIYTKLSLKDDSSFVLLTSYLGKDVNFFGKQGIYKWDAKSKRVILISEGDEDGTTEFVIEDGKAFTDGIALAKVEPQDIENGRWLLEEIYGSSLPELSQVTPSVEFDIYTGKVSGVNGCNRFFGSYMLTKGNRFILGELGTTMMSCPDMEIERSFMEMLGSVDTYVIVADTLWLHKSRSAPFARFIREKRID